MSFKSHRGAGGGAGAGSPSRLGSSGRFGSSTPSRSSTPGSKYKASSSFRTSATTTSTSSTSRTASSNRLQGTASGSGSSSSRLKGTASGSGSSSNRLKGTSSSNRLKGTSSFRSSNTQRGITSKASKSLVSRGGSKLSASQRVRDITTRPVAVNKPEKLPFEVADLKVLATLGTGTFGRVRLVNHPNGKYYALKIMKKYQVVRMKQVDHIKNEVKILSMISHPFIVNLIGHKQSRSHLYMLLEFVPGGELFSILRRENRISNDAARFYASEVVLAFQYLHSFKIAYRDLKPENLLVTSTGHLKIADFGFAKVVEDRTWTLCGTPEYLAPEIIQSKGHGRSVDWWAVGILIYEMLAGFPPYVDDSPMKIYSKIITGRLAFPRHFTSAARDLIKKLLAADRTQRLGCLRNGAEDIKSHRWFGTGFDWDVVYNCKLKPPYVPRVSGEADTTNFDEYPSSEKRSIPALTTAQQDQFADFDTL